MSVLFVCIIVPIVKWVAYISITLCIIYLFVDHYGTKKEIRELKECECMECNLDTTCDIFKVKNEEKKTRKWLLTIITVCLIILALIRLI